MSHHIPHQTSIGISARNRIDNITGTQVQQLLVKLDIIKSFLPSTFPLQQLVSAQDYTSGEVNNIRGGSGKHVLQECSILGHLRRIGAFGANDHHRNSNFNRPLIAIEIGAGTGRLSERLQRVSQESIRHVMIDRVQFAPTQCRDGKMRKLARDTTSVSRVVEDIAYLDLGKYCDGQSRCFCMSKHLCGPACDLAILAMERVTPPSRRPPLAFATCCHYLCTFDEFAGKEYWIQLGLTVDDFEVAAAVSQWYSLKKKSAYDTVDERLNDNNCDSARCTDYETCINNAALAPRQIPFPASEGNISSKEFERNFSTEDKSKLGHDIKCLMDILRVAKLQELGYEAEIVLYTDRSIENRLLAGKVVM